MGTKGKRGYDWVRVPLWRLQLSGEERRYDHYLLVRRSRDDKQERAYYVVYAYQAQADLKTRVQVAGHRWEIESGFEETKGECGLDHDEVRRWKSGYRHITLSLLAHAVLAVLRIQEKKTLEGLIALSVSELRKLLSKLMEKTGETVEQIFRGIRCGTHWGAGTLAYSKVTSIDLSKPTTHQNECCKNGVTINFILSNKPG
nr:transposase [Xenorhabdus anantnagensis]